MALQGRLAVSSNPSLPYTGIFTTTPLLCPSYKCYMTHRFPDSRDCCAVGEPQASPGGGLYGELTSPRGLAFALGFWEVTQKIFVYLGGLGQLDTNNVI